MAAREIEARSDPALDAIERTQSEQTLRDIQRMLLDAQRIGHVRAWEEDLRTGVVRIGVGEADESGVQSIPREQAWQSIHPDDRERLLELRRRTIESGGPFEVEYRALLPEGERVVIVRGELVRDASGKPERIVGSSVDITERKRAEEALHRSQRLLRLVIDTLPVGVSVVDARSDILLTNGLVDQIWGRTIVRGEERYRLSKASWHGSGEPIRPEQWASRRALARGETSLNELIDIETFDGRRKIMQNSAAPIRDERQAIIGAVIVNEDVTDRVLAEEALRKNRQLLLEAETLGHTGSWELDVETGAVVNTAENLRLFFGDDRTKGASLDDFANAVHPDDREWVMKRREQLMANDRSPDIEYRVIWPDGSVHVIFGRATVVRDAAGKPIRVYGTNADVTERKRAEQELRRHAKQQAAIAKLSLLAMRGDSLQAVFDEAVQLLTGTLEVERGMILEALPDGSLAFRAGVGVSKDADFTSWPIPGRERPFGVLGAHSTKQRAFSEDEVSFAASVANLLGTAIEQRRAAAEVAEKREQLQALSRELIEAQEAERRAVARELHDDFGQVLTAIKLNLMRRGDGQGESIALVDGAIARMRDLAQDLRPPLLDELGLPASLRWYVQREATRAGLEWAVDLGTFERRPSSSVETTSFRVAQEALTNVIRHAGATRVDVELRIAGDRLELRVRDDGTGFDVNSARKRAARGGSQGLLSMHERVALAGGELSIESSAAGTSVRAVLPLGSAG